MPAQSFAGQRLWVLSDAVMRGRLIGSLCKAAYAGEPPYGLF
jgi:hypothetical protein